MATARLSISGAVGPARCSSATHLSRRNGHFAGSQLLASRPVSSTPTERGSLLVMAGKGKGKKMFRSRGGGSGAQRQMPPTPPVDPDNEEFVLFVRSKKLPQWIPLSVVKGGTSANMLVKSMNGSFGQSTFRDTLVRNIGEVLYKDREEIEESLKQQFPPMRNAKEFEYGFKIRDRTRPNSWYVAENVFLIPPEDELPKPVLGGIQEKASNFFQNLGKGGQTA